MVRKFIVRKFASNWKVKKHYGQIREVLRKHANSKFSEIQNYIIKLVKGDLKPAVQFDSIAFPHYVYLLEDSEHCKAY
jgi:hypothetical protein